MILMPVSITLDNRCHYNKKRRQLMALAPTPRAYYCWGITFHLFDACLGSRPFSRVGMLSFIIDILILNHPYCEALVHTPLSEVTCDMPWEFSPGGKILVEWNITPCLTSRVLHRGGKMFLCQSVFFTW